MNANYLKCADLGSYCLDYTNAQKLYFTKKSKSRIFEQYNLLLRACSSEPSLIPSVVSNFFQNEAHIAFQSRAEHVNLLLSCWVIII